jgi:FKBP-type peptidyl-prolyl cis-trans isomerase FkpA
MFGIFYSETGPYPFANINRNNILAARHKKNSRAPSRRAFRAARIFALAASPFIALQFSTLSALAQTPAHKPIQVMRPNTNSPTKVTGDGVKTDDGLQYWDIKVGAGDIAKDGDHVKVHYTGWFADTGKKFDSSVDAHQPYDFTLGKGNVIKGWDEGVAGMKVGGKRQLRIPPELAYGEAGYKTIIPPNATLIFDVQLLAITPAPPAAAAPPAPPN